MATDIDNKKPNWYVRILIILLCIFIGGLIYFNFVWTCPPAQISGGILVLVAFLTILVLSEGFDNFSISKLITLSRTVTEKETKNQELKRENTELRNQIVSISTNISQKQVNSTVVLTNELAKLFTVKQADEPEKAEKRNETEEPTEERQTARRVISFSKFEEVALPKFLQAEGLHQLPLVRDAKLVSQFQQVDPVSEYSPIFDGYIKTIDTEIFIEMKSKRMGPMLRERLYIMLSKINYYRTIKKVNAYLYLVLIVRPDDEEQSGGRHNSSVDRILQEFEPAITNGLLQVRTIEITQQENDSIVASD
ncbi:MAG: hypothetical protein RJA76_295 [Bacteroidota bacterium]